MEEAARQDFFSERYGWTVHETRDQPLMLIEAMYEVAMIKDELEAEEIRKARGSDGG